jgi:predicted phosphodiesterase
MSISWTEEEIKVLTKLLSLDNPTIIKNTFITTLDSQRTDEAIFKKIRKLKQDNSNKNLMITEQDLLYQPVSSVDKKNWTEASISWLLGLQHLSKTVVNQPKTKIEYNANTKTLVVCISDVHVGKRPSTNEYEYLIRLDSIATKIKEIVRGTKDKINELVIVLDGDLCEGEDIFPTQNTKTVFPVIVQVSNIVSVLVKVINNLYNDFEKITVYSVPGNHGRMSKTAHPMSNWDNVIIWALSLVYAENDKVDINVNFKEFLRITIRDKNILMTHQGTKHTGTAAMRERIAGWVYNKEVDLIIQAHWHSAGFSYWNGVPVISNGSLCGSDDLSEYMAREDPARQAYFFIENNKPIDGCSFFSWI